MLRKPYLLIYYTYFKETIPVFFNKKYFTRIKYYY